MLNLTLSNDVQFNLFPVLLSYKLLSRGIMVALWFLAAMLHMVNLRLKFKILILILYIYG